jgi:ADP-ribosyl-[dinitrogen reductase] hydrolase
VRAGRVVLRVRRRLLGPDIREPHADPRIGQGVGPIASRRVTVDEQAERDRFRGCLLGLAVGDALGTTVEFKSPGTFAPVTDMVGGGPFDLPAGAWTDDTSMAMCLAESLVEVGDFDPVDQLSRYRDWYRDGYWSSTGVCFDIGNATRAAIERFERTGEPFPGDAAPEAAGNGPLMKLAPVPMALAGDVEAAIRHAGESARTTHGAPEAIDAARLFAARLLVELRGAPVPYAPQEPALQLLGERREVRGGGYVVESLHAALWAFETTRTFEEAVLAAVNLGDDADTTAAICGQLAGAHYGIGAIPARWRERVHRGDEIVAMADALHALASRRLGSRFRDALGHAARLHAGQRRKGTSIPYVSHLLAVASTVIEDGGSEDEAIAALLHDAAEDQGGEPVLDDIRARYGAVVASIVAECSDTFEDPKPPWRERKAAYLNHLEHASGAAIRVSLADKLHNARAIVRDLAVDGPDVWSRFNRGRDDQLWYYGALADVFARRRPGVLSDELRELVARMSAVTPASPPLPPAR